MGAMILIQTAFSLRIQKKPSSRNYRPRFSLQSVSITDKMEQSFFSKGYM